MKTITAVALRSRGVPFAGNAKTQTGSISEYTALQWQVQRQQKQLDQIERGRMSAAISAEAARMQLNSIEASQRREAERAVWDNPPLLSAPSPAPFPPWPALVNVTGTVPPVGLDGDAPGGGFADLYHLPGASFPALGSRWTTIWYLLAPLRCGWSACISQLQPSEAYPS